MKGIENIPEVNIDYDKLNKQYLNQLNENRTQEIKWKLHNYKYNKSDYNSQCRK